MDFPDYAIKYSKEGLESKRRLPEDLVSMADDIVNALANDPLTPRAEVVPASRDGKVFIYANRRPQLQITYEVDAKEKIIFVYHFAAPAFTINKTLFISYSHEDKDWLTQFRAHLSTLEQQGVVEFWDDGMLVKGEKWKQQIEKALSDCVGGVLLVTPEFLDSPFIADVEVASLLSAAAKDNKKKIFWVHVRPCDEANERLQLIKQYQSLLDPKIALSSYTERQRVEALKKIASDISAAVMH